MSSTACEKKNVDPLLRCSIVAITRYKKVEYSESSYRHLLIHMKLFKGKFLSKGIFKDRKGKERSSEKDYLFPKYNNRTDYGILVQKLCRDYLLAIMTYRYTKNHKEKIFKNCKKNYLSIPLSFKRVEAGGT